LRIAAPHQVAAVWVRGHNGHPENELMDDLAQQCAHYRKVPPVLVC
jgi:ribonuclease HI